jgi:hypothetical protein
MFEHALVAGRITLARSRGLSDDEMAAWRGHITNMVARKLARMRKMWARELRD